MSGRQMMASRTYLEMRDPRQLRPAKLPGEPVTIEKVDLTPAEWRDLYVRIGRAYHWVDRLPWSEQEIAAYLADPAVSVFVMRVAGKVAGYFELRQDPTDGVEIAYFGMLREFHGRGLGGHLLTFAAERAWELNPPRVWLHTSSMDHAAALPNYLNRGFTIVKREGYIVSV
ncbi:MAG TPA: GNAT family N-acetyltransferase [Vicinamibacterales bacterium]